MTSSESERAGEQAVEALEPESGLLAALDPVSFASALGRTALAAAGQPTKVLLAPMSPGRWPPPPLIGGGATPHGRTTRSTST